MSRDNATWQTLSPFALVYFVTHFFVRFIKDGILNLLPAFAVLLFQVENKLIWLSLGSTLFVIGVVTYATLYYLFFKYKLTDDEILLQRGVVRKQQLNLNFARIQNVNLSSPFYFSPFNLVNTQLDAAGSKGQEIVLPGICKAKAEVLRKEIFAYTQSNPQETEQLEEAGGESKEPDFVLSNKEVAKFGFFSTTLLLFFIFIAPFQRHFTPVLKDQLILPLSSQLSSVITDESLVYALATFTIFLAIVLLMLAISVITAVVRFYNFELLVDGGKVKRICGLFERAQFSLQKSKIQSVEVNQNWLAKLFKRYTLICKQINSSNASDGRVKNQKALIVPVLTQERLLSVLELCSGQSVDLLKLAYTGVSIRLFYKNVTLFVFLPSLIFTVIGFAYNEPIFFALMSTYAVLATMLCHLRYKRYGYAFIDGYVVVRRGLIGVSYQLFAPYKIQHISQRQTPMMVKHNIASLRFGLASGNITIPYMPQDIVLQQINQSLHLAESNGKHWM